MTEMRNVHEFDGMIHMRDLIEVGKEEEKELQTIFSNRSLNPEVKRMWEMIIQRDGQNYDVINASDAYPLLMSLLKKIISMPESDHEEWFLMLEEQLHDMIRLGPCPQGRTIRLWQLYCCLPTS